MLVVEDEFLIVMDITMMLEQRGFTVLGLAASVEGALELLEDGQPDVALLDVKLRGQLVFPVAERLRSLTILFVLALAYQGADLEGSNVLAGVANVGKLTSEENAALSSKNSWMKVCSG